MLEEIEYESIQDPINIIYNYIRNKNKNEVEYTQNGVKVKIKNKQLTSFERAALTCAFYIEEVLKIEEKLKEE